jgi:hypothetical protein
MATVTFIPYKSQSAGALRNVTQYIAQDKKTDNGSFVSGLNCSPQFAYQEFITTWQVHRKDSPVFFYHYVQSFHPDEPVTGKQAHEIAKQFAEKVWPESEVLVATHVDAGHIHSHFVINAVCYETGKMLRQGPTTLAKIRPISDSICAAHGLSVLPPQQQENKSQGMSSREYRSAVKGESWKLQLMSVIDECMRYAQSKDEFISLMRSEGYDVKWTDTRKSITYTCPNGMKCRDDRLHEPKYTKEMMEAEFRNRAEIIHGGIEAEKPTRHGMDSVTRGLGRADSPSAEQFQETGELPDLHPNRGTDERCEGVTANGRTGWEEEQEILFSAETELTRDTPQPRTVTRSARLIGALGAVVQLGAALERLSVHTPIRDTTTLPHRVDRKRWKKIMRKRLALGHKIDDHATTMTM